jgi:hypothetical protein
MITFREFEDANRARRRNTVRRGRTLPDEYDDPQNM